jgi:rhodanese-related sulfurtransferase
LEGSSHVYVPDLATYHFDELAKGDEVWVACGTGYRANIAAGILTQKGLRPVVLADGGVPDLIQKTQEPLAASASR